MKNLTQEWVSKAEEDFIVAKREQGIEPSVYNAICFHSQQCVEKYMKAILQENDVFFEKTHDLDILLEKCKTFIPELAELRQGLIEFSSFAVEIRYPGATATREETNQFLELTEKIRLIIRKYFKLE